MATSSRHKVTATIRSRLSGWQKTLEFLVIPSISELEPQQFIDRSSVQIPANIKLADPEFHKPAPVDLLLGTAPTLSVFSVGQLNVALPQTPDLILQKTLLGWIIGGSVLSPASRDNNTQIPSSILNGTPSPDIKSSNNLAELRREPEAPLLAPQKNCLLTRFEFDMKQFWEIEEGSSKPHLSMEEKACEEHFQRHVHRDADGRYIVALPFNNNKNRLGYSRTRAMKRFHALQRRFKQDPVFKERYTAVMQEYLDLGHMSQVHDSDNDGFFLPHHAVIKETSMTTKLRVVFDGSAKTDSGISLNESLMVGPTVQDDLFAHVLRFRLHNYVLTGDIEKMYRQFLVRKEDRKFQRILWTDSTGIIKTFELNTVTFGLASAPFLATRCLQQLGDDDGHRYTYAGNIVKRDLYVDDLLTGAASFKEAITLRDEIIDLLQRAGLNIRQWASNSPKLLQGLPAGHVKMNLQDHGDQTVKTLGVVWNSQRDSIVYSVQPNDVKMKITKRTILSEIAKIFDPLGLLGPVIITAKQLMQQLWQLKLDWDETVPTHIHYAWTNYRTQLNLLNDLAFERHLLLRDADNIQLHGFCDASERGYGACIYLRSSNTKDRVQSRLLCAKSRVAPLKAVTLPRLELCAAHLLSNLYQTVMRSIHVKINQAIFWTDSTITLHWINSSPHLLKTFVANRVSEIQDKTTGGTWRHVRSQDNPADALSRGQSPSEFIQNSIWKTGPIWITKEKSSWPQLHLPALQNIPEVKQKICLVTRPISSDLLQRYSSVSKLRRIIAYCLRFKRNNLFKGALCPQELNAATKTIIRLVQQECFTDETQDLASGRRVHRKSKLTTLDPFLDQDNIIRVGGRLKHADIPFSQQHPIVLPRSHHITTLIIREEHERNMHAGIQATLYSVRQRYWPIDGRNQTRRVIRQCMKCFRANPPNTEYVMGNLPKARVNEDRPFNNVGIDYCGPFFIKEKKHRNRTKVKVYVAVFVCLAVKAVHLELVSDLTTDAFLAALRRFFARRGKCQNIYSDNGTNFVGANRELQHLFNSEEHQQKITAQMSNDGVKWSFIPPRSPHFGGLWEAAVKSFKHHFKRVIGNELLTYEQFTTFLTETEAILNSRPLTPMSTDPSDMSALTPGHFLIGNALNALPEHDFRDTPSNQLSIWQHLSKLKRDFWARWYKEYLNELNIRHKWTSGNHGIVTGSLVVIKEDNLPPLQWALGRVSNIHPGSDGIIRTVTIQTPQGEIKRNVKKLALLPIFVNNGDCN